MLKAVAWAGWLFIGIKERAVGVRTGQTTETHLTRERAAGKGKRWRSYLEFISFAW